MKLSPAQEASIAALMTRLYDDIHAIESEFALHIGGGDFRPRIEYFHDAIRAFTSDDAGQREAGGRLCVETLAYDLACLRYLHAMPLSPFTPHAANLSPHVEMVKLDQLLVAKATRPDRATKERLGELYQNYAMLFAALLKPFADADYHERTDSLNHDVRDVNAIAGQLEAMLGGKGGLDALAGNINHLEDAQLRHELLSFLQAQGHKKKENIRKLLQYLKDKTSAKDKEIQAIEEAHMNYALAQLGVYESSKDLLKKMAGQGMNLVGQFVESAMAQTRREMGR
jgi:hypothetical protein